jgi:hypothetical protein
MHARTLLIPACVVALALAQAACGGSSSSSTGPNPNAAEKSPPGDIPDNQAYVRFHPAGGDFSLAVPEGWARSTSGGAVTFTDNLNHVRVEETSAPVALTVRDARQTEVPKLAKTVNGFRAGTVTTVTRPAGRAVRMTYLAEASPNPVTGKPGPDAVERYVFFHRGKDLVLTLSGPKGADNVDPWKIITGSVRWSG